MVSSRYFPIPFRSSAAYFSVTPNGWKAVPSAIEPRVACTLPNSPSSKRATLSTKSGLMITSGTMPDSENGMFWVGYKT